MVLLNNLEPKICPSWQFRMDMRTRCIGVRVALCYCFRVTISWHILLPSGSGKLIRILALDYLERTFFFSQVALPQDNLLDLYSRMIN